MIINFINQIPDFLSDAFVDSIKLLPCLLLIFIVIEVFENYFAHKITHLISISKKLGIVIGALLAIIPQCGFSVVMTTLFLKKYITIGTLIAVYIATSDEAIPILLTTPSQFNIVGELIAIKLFVAIVSGYLIDLFIKTDLKDKELEHLESEKGCCNHDIIENKMKNIIIHPIKHTFNIFLFIFIICTILNYFLLNYPLENLTFNNSLWQPVLFSFIGLIPNCATSVFIVMMFIKGVLGFGSVVAGLTTNAGLGLIVLFSKKENIKVAIKTTLILLLIGILSGVCLTLINNLY